MPPNKLTPGYNLMWESSRMMLPEHREHLLEETRKEYEFQIPLLDDNQLEQMNRVIMKSIEQKLAVTITYAEKYGPATFYGFVQKVNIYEGWLKVRNSSKVITLSFQRILEVEMN